MTTEEALEMIRTKLEANAVAINRWITPETVSVLVAFPDGDTASRFENHIVSVDYQNSTVRVFGH